MAITSTMVAIAGLGLSAFGSYQQSKAAGRAADAQQKSLRLQQRQAAIKASRERIGQIRDARRARAAVIASGVNAGVGGSSGVAGGVGGIQSNLAGNLAFSRNIQSLGEQATSANVASAGYTADANMWGAVSNAGGFMFSDSERISGSVNKMFKS